MLFIFFLVSFLRLFFCYSLLLAIIVKEQENIKSFVFVLEKTTKIVVSFPLVGQ